MFVGKKKKKMLIILVHEKEHLKIPKNRMKNELVNVLESFVLLSGVK